MPKYYVFFTVPMRLILLTLDATLPGGRRPLGLLNAGLVTLAPPSSVVLFGPVNVDALCLIVFSAVFTLFVEELLNKLFLGPGVGLRIPIREGVAEALPDEG